MVKLQFKPLQRDITVGLLKNSAWGIGANILQLVFLSLFFVIIARKYNADNFAHFLIATTIYQLFSAFSSMGLGQWFIRKYVTEDDKPSLISKFLKTQIGLGAVFYLVNLIFAYGMYEDAQIQMLSLILGTNIIFENFINALKALNQVEGRQDKTALIMVFDGLLKLTVAALLFVEPFSATTLALLMVIARLFTLGLFLKIGSSSTLNLRLVRESRVTLGDLKTLVLNNWRFMIIGSLSILYWRVGNIIISKILSLADVAEYELSFRIFSVMLVLPVIASATVYPQLIRLEEEKNSLGLKRLYNFLFGAYTIAAYLAYSFVFSFSEGIISVAFGNQYPGAAISLQQMFLAFLIMPTVLLQANLIVALRLENKDMLFNLFSILLNIAACLIGLYFFRSLAIVNYSIFFSLLVFHILQSILLIKKGITSISHALGFYLLTFLTILIFNLLPGIIDIYYVFAAYAIAIILISLMMVLAEKKIILAMLGKNKKEDKLC